MGFKSIDSIKPYYNLRESYFIYPNDNISKGSGKLVNALIKQMANKKKCAIVKYIGREGSMIKLCALFPQLERLDEDFFQTPPGLNMIVLPFADDIRSNSEILSQFPRELPTLTDRQKEMARKIVKRMNITFDCRAFENVELQRFYATLQALALNEATIDRTEDKIQPHREGLMKVLAGIDDKYRMSIFTDNNNNNDKDAKKKKKKGKNSDSESESNYSNHKKKKHKQRGPKKSKRRIFKYDTSTESELSSSDSIESLSSGSSALSSDSPLSSDSEYSSDSDSSNSESSESNNKKGKKTNNKSNNSKAKNGNKGKPANNNKGKPKETKEKKEPGNKNNKGKRRKKDEDSSSSSDSEEAERERHREEKRRERERRPKVVTDERLIKLVRDKILEKMSIEDLKGICSGKGISTKGMKRQDMLDKLQTNKA